MSTDKTALTEEQRKEIYKKLYEWEKINNPFFPNPMRYEREDLISFAKEFSSQQNKELIEENERLRNEKEALGNALQFDINSYREQISNMNVKIEELEKEALEREIKLNTYITDSTNLTVQNNSLQSQLQESQQMNERLVLVNDEILAGLQFVMMYANKTESLIQDVSFTDQLGDINRLLSSTKEKGAEGCVFIHCESCCYLERCSENKKCYTKFGN